MSDGHIHVVFDLRHRPAVNLFGRSRRTVSRGDVKRVDVACVVEMYELLQALDVAVVEELFLEVRSRSVGASGALCRHQSYIACRRGLHLAIGTGCELPPGLVWAGPGSVTAPQEFSESQISIGKAYGIARESKRVWRCLVIERISGIQRQAQIGRTEAGEQRSHIRVRTGFCETLAFTCIAPVKMTGIAIGLAVEQRITRRLVFGHGVLVGQERVELLRERADIHGLFVGVDSLRPVVIIVIGKITIGCAQ